VYCHDSSPQANRPDAFPTIIVPVAGLSQAGGLGCLKREVWTAHKFNEDYFQAVWNSSFNATTIIANATKATTDLKN
jgi:hypothetical protein